MEGVLPVKKIYPTVDECKINNSVTCMEEGCQHVFNSESNLALHLVKRHKRSNFTANVFIKQYHCPQSGCVYQSDKHFKNMKRLRQHFLKVHIAKDYACDSCNKKFPTDNQLKHHIDYCGVYFKCHECDVFYSSYETLKTHARRKKHHILAKSEYKISATSSNSDPNIVKATPILPKNCISLILIPDADNVYNQGSQTMDHKPKLKSKMTQVTRFIDSDLNSQQTQTGTKNNHYTVETQTMGDFIHVEPSKSADDLLDSILHKSSKTQTDIVESRSTSSNTSFNFNDFEFIAQAEMTSSSTQTQNRSNNIYSISTSTHDSIHTDTSDLMHSSMSSINNFEFDNCHMETQTDDFMLGEGMFDCDYMSNMYTQTCDQILNEFGFNDIETQTVFDDMLRSVESQTTMSRGKRISTNKDVTHMETQTEMEFRQMLEVIHS